MTLRNELCNNHAGGKRNQVLNFGCWEIDVKFYSCFQIKITVRPWKPSQFPYSPIKYYKINTLFDRKINGLHDRHDISKRVIIKSRTLFVIFCFRTAQGFARMKNFFLRIALKIFLSVFHQISRLFFFFCPVFFFLLFRLLPRVQTGTISSGPVQVTKILKICPGR